MQASLPKKCRIGLALGVALASKAQAAEQTGSVSGVADGLMHQLVYLPAGLLVAALLLEMTARARGSKSLHAGVLALLAATTVAALVALIISLTAGTVLQPLSGSPFASRELGIAFVALSMLACLTKAMSLRFHGEAANSGEPTPAKKRGRGRGRRRRAASRGIAPGKMIAVLSRSAYVVSLLATLVALIAGSIIQDPSQARTIVETDQPPAERDATPAKEIGDGLSVSAPAPSEPLPSALAATGEAGDKLEIDPRSETSAVDHPAIAPIPDQSPLPEIASATTGSEIPTPTPPSQPEGGAPESPEPTAVEVAPEKPPASPPAEGESRLPTPTVRPVSTQHGGLAGAETYKKLIQPLFRSRCYDCHGEEKQKGDLRLDSPEHIRLGGKSGPMIIAGNPEKSYLFELISLDESDDDIMPPKGKPLSAAQISWIGGWIREGAALGDGVAWPSPEGDQSGEMAADPASDGIATADQQTVQMLLDGGVIVRQLSANGALLEVDYSHADRATGDLRLGELEPIAHNIHTLDLKRTKVTDDDMVVLEKMTNLRQLHLQRTGITDAALPHLVDLKNLESLNLYSTQVSDAGLPTLRQLTSLKKLYLWSSKVTAPGARELAGVLGSDVVNMGE